MPMRDGRTRRFPVGIGTAFGIAAALLFFALSGTLAYSNIQGLRADTARVVHTHEVITELSTMLAAIQDAETGQRGYLLTGVARYLQPYEDARGRAAISLGRIEALVADNPAQQARLRQLKPRVDAKLAEPFPAEGTEEEQIAWLETHMAEALGGTW